MAKTKISEYDSTASNNTDVDGINIAESCPPSGINNAIREVMAHLKDFQTGASGDSFTSAGTLNVTGNFQLDGSAGTSGQVLLSAGSGVTPTWGDAFVTGMIMMWSGSIATIPSGWALCDGTSGTPDLRNKMIVAANADDAGVAKTTVTGSATQTGGSKDAIVVSHTHTGSTASAGNHFHYAASNESVLGTSGTRVSSSTYISYDHDDGAGSWQQLYDLRGVTSEADVGKTNTTGAHTHSITMDSAGSSGTNANLPPYYALAFIMKL